MTTSAKAPGLLDAFLEENPGCYVRAWEHPRSKGPHDRWVACIWEPEAVVNERPRFVLALAVGPDEEKARAALNAHVPYARRLRAKLEETMAKPFGLSLINILHDAQWRRDGMIREVVP
jgi:hypothetical protein